MKGDKINPEGRNGLRRDLTIELITQLNEVLEHPVGSQRIKLHKIVGNLILHAMGRNEYDAEGRLVKEDIGDLAAIREIFDRLEGRPRQKIVGHDDGPVQTEFRTVEEVRMFLLERGIDSLRVPPPLKLIDCGKGS